MNRYVLVQAIVSTEIMISVIFHYLIWQFIVQNGDETEIFQNNILTYADAIKKIGNLFVKEINISNRCSTSNSKVWIISFKTLKVTEISLIQ